MRAERWQELKRVFEGARRRRGTARQAFLERACPEDSGIRREVESLLAYQQTTGRFRAAFGDAELAFDDRAPAPGSRLGPYRLVRKLGEGGMGRVFLAVRDDGAYRQQIAVKVLHPWMANDEVVGRLRQERQILAGLDHPWIVALLDGGATEDGAPFLVMEYVEGQPIDRFCASRGLDVRALLELFLKVCAAVHHAHCHLVVHRDLKPSNILVNAEGDPCLLDFGIAKILNRAVLGPPAEETGLRFLTPEFASPEQLRRGPVKTSSDVYSLGAVLYLLLAGRPPHDLAGKTPGEAERTICEDEPAPPSAVLRDAPLACGRRLAKDLDAIALKALEKAPERRYASVDQLADDLRRALEDEPVRARRASFSYRSAKFVRRHRHGLAAAALAGACLTAGLVAALWQARAAWRERAVAEAARSEAERYLALAETQGRRAEEVSAFLLTLFESAGEGQELTAPDLLERGLERIDRQPGADPEVQAALLDTLGQVSVQLGLLDQGGKLLSRALALRRRLLGPAHPAVGESLRHLARLHHDRGELTVAETLVRQSLEIDRASLGEDDPEIADDLKLLGIILHGMGEDAAAEEAYREALVRWRRLSPEADDRLADTLLELGELLARAGAPDEAERVLEESLALSRRLWGPDHLRVAAALNELGVVLGETGREEAAEDLLRKALEMHRRHLGEKHPLVATNLNDLALLVRRRGDPAQAEELGRQALALRREIFGEEHPAVADSLNDLAGALREQEKYAEADAAYRRALAIYRKVHGAGSPAEATVLNNLGLLLRAEGKLDEAVPLLEQALALRRQVLGKDDPALATSLLSLGGLLEKAGRCREAQPLLRESWEIYAASLGPDDWQSGAAESVLGFCLAELGSAAEAEVHLRGGYEVLLAEKGPENPRTLRARDRLRGFLESREPSAAALPR